MAPDTLVRIAESQDGLVTRRQALQSGMSARAVTYAISKRGSWQRVLHGVYAMFNGPLTDLHRFRAAHLYAGPNSRITGAWACWMCGLNYGPPTSENIVILVPHAYRRAATGFVRITRSRRPYNLDHYWVDHSIVDDVQLLASMMYGPDNEIRRTPIRGVIPKVAPARAIIDTISHPMWLPVDWQPTCPSAGCPVCAGGVSHHVRALRNIRALMCEVVQRKLCTIAELAAELGGAPRNHTAIGRRVVAELEAGCRSAPECELRDLVLSSKVLPDARWNRVLPGARGIYPDACWPEARLVVEVDSRAFHGFGDAPERTERRRARYAELGWTVLPVSPRRLREEPNRVLREIEAAYVAGVAR